MKLSQKLLFKLVRIDWVDSSFGSSWEIYKERSTTSDGSLLCESVGWVIAISADAVTISGNISGLGTPDFQNIGSMTIPDVAIKRVTLLKTKDSKAA